VVRNIGVMMFNRISNHVSPSALRAAALVIATILIVASGWIVHTIAIQAGLSTQSNAANDRLTLLASTLDARVERFRYLPTVLAQADPILDVYRNPEEPGAIAAANQYLKSLNDAAGSLDLFIVDRNGIALAASNYLEEASFIGQNYAFRPYFTEAQRASEGRYFAVGVTTGKPGYFLWHSIVESGRVLGVALVKVDLDPLQIEWKRTGELVALVDPNAVIFLTSQPDWQYRPISRISEEQLQLLRNTRQYGYGIADSKPLFDNEHLERDSLIVQTAAADSTASRSYVVLKRDLPAYGWTLLTLFDFQSVQAQAIIAAATVMLAVLTSLLVLLVTHQRRQIIRTKLEAHEFLERRVTERTVELAAANASLSAEVTERVRAEEDLRRTQEGLIHVAKMASLGQALAGVAHEINQSLAALNAYIAGMRVFAERNDKNSISSNLNLISSITERMGALTGHLKSFARKDTVAKQATDFSAAIRYGLRLVEYRLTDEKVTLRVNLPERPVYVMGNAVRLEQVIVNLLSNALDAMHARTMPCLTVELLQQHPLGVLKISDTGHGIARENIGSIFDPFFTSKEVGQGLGLGLSISYGIIKDMGGDIAVESEVDVGTTFCISLQAISDAIPADTSEPNK
jgi:two-component system, NtrC family, C4-dicarboxylate transport sensor histidine kinase DctB